MSKPSGGVTRRITALAAASALGMALVTGCGTETLDQGELEDELAADLGASAGVEPQGVECPDDIEAEQGTEFECTLIAPNGDEVRVEGTVTNDEGGFEATVPPQQFE